jgi:hypothetical protein
MGRVEQCLPAAIGRERGTADRHALGRIAEGKPGRRG